MRVDINHPNVFIIGAPKAGTTSLACWLAQHPEVFVPKIKEPSFFYHPNQAPMTKQQYLGLYKKAGDRKIRLDASVWYLFSEQAICKIHGSCASAKFIVCLRKPADMFFSLHQQKIWSGQELLIDPVSAWDVRTRRAEGERIGMCLDPNGDPRHMAYHLSCALGSQVERLLKIVDKEKVFFVWFEDLLDAPERVYFDLCGWLNIKDDVKIVFKHENKAKMPRFMALNRFFLSVSKYKRRLGFSVGTGVIGMISKFNAIERKLPPVSADFYAYIVESFANETFLLEQLLKRDLVAWRCVVANK